MAQLGNLVVTGESRLLNKVYCGSSLSVTGGITTNGNLTVTGSGSFGSALETNGTLNVGKSTAANALLYLNSKLAVKGNDSWLRINETRAFTEGIYFGGGIVRTDGVLQVGGSGSKALVSQSGANFAIPVTISNALTANSVTATNATINNTLKAYKYEAYSIQNLGGEFIVAPTLYIQSTATISTQAGSDGTTLVVKIKDTKAITGNAIQGVRWTQGSLIKFMGKINGIALNCEGTMNANLNTETNVISLTLTVDSGIGKSFSQTLTAATSFSDVSVMMYRIKGVNASGTSTYTPLGIRLSTSGTQSDGSDYAHIDIWGTQSGTSSDTLLSAPNVRLGYLSGLPNLANGVTPGGWGLYADNAFLKGSIVASSGKIGGFTIGTTSLSNGTTGASDSVLVSTGTTNKTNIGGSGTGSHTWAFTAGSTFGVTTDGALYANNANITGTVTATSGSFTGTVNATSGSFTGTVTATSGSFTGTVNANSGKIGGFTIGTTSLSNGTTGASDSVLVSTGTTNKTNIGGSGTGSHTWAFTAGSTFGVTTDGALYANNVNITGTVKADAGYIGAFAIDGNYDNSLNVSSTDGNRTLVMCRPTSDALSSCLALFVNNMANWKVNNDGSMEFYNGKGISLNNGSIDTVKELDATTVDATTVDATTVHATTVDATTVDATTVDATTVKKNGNTIGQTFISDKSSTNKAVPNNSWTATGAAVSMSAMSRCLVIGEVYFNSAKGGRRGARLVIDGTGYDRCTNIISANESGSATYSLQVVYVTDSASSISLQAYQSSGGSINVTSYLKVVRIL